MSPPKKKPPDCMENDSSNILISSGNDTFDALANFPMKGKKDFLLKSECKNPSLSSSSASSSNEAFLSALHANDSKVSEMFLTSPLNLKPKDGMSLNVKRLPSPSNQNYLKTRNNNLLENNVRGTPKTLRTQINVLTKVVTSTPTINCSDTNQKWNQKEIMHNDLSPVEKENSCLFEMSSSLESDTSPFKSCYGDYHSAHSQPKIKELRSNKKEKTMEDCLVLLEKLDSLIISQSSAKNFSKDLFDDKSSELSHLKKTQSYCYTPEISFHRVTRRQKKIVDDFKFRKRKTVLLHNSKTNFMNLSHFDTNTSIRMFGRDSSTFNAQKFKYKISTPERHKQKSELSNVSSSEAFSQLKSGKGWRRSLKKVSNVRAFQSLSMSCAILEECNNEDEEGNQVCSILDLQDDAESYVLNLCNQRDVVPISCCFNEKVLQNSKKIGEGVYGEVFMYVPPSSSECGERRVLKLMPIEGDFEVNGEPQKSFQEIAAEMVVSKALSDLQGSDLKNSTSAFVSVHRCWCVKGAYPAELLQLWDSYAEKKESENDRPDLFPDSQIHIVLEFGFAGQDLESYVFNNAMQAHSSFMQIAYALGVAEKAHEFEHRDLHWGNVLIAPTTHSSHQFKIMDHSIELKSNGVKATIIDFTLSRLLVDGKIFFNDLSKDPSLFTAEGDYQFDIYRKMQQINENDWKRFTPSTNIHWLHYIVLKLINDCYYKNKTTKIHKEGMRRFKSLKDTLLQYSSVMEFVCDVDDLELELK